MPGFFITVSKDDLQHYGVLGMKWGIRRFQNKDGTLTEAGRSRYSKNVNNVEDIKKVISSLKKGDYSDFSLKNIRYSSIEYDKGKPIGFAYCRQYNVDDALGVVMSVATNPNYRGKGISKKLVNDVVKKAEKDPEVYEITWAADKDNYGSINTAKACGFEHWYDYENDTVYRYRKA